MDKKLTLEQ